MQYIRRLEIAFTSKHLQKQKQKQKAARPICAVLYIRCVFFTVLCMLRTSI